MLQRNFFKSVLSIFILVSLSGFYSCSDNGDDEGDNGGGDNNQSKAVVGKWEVSNQNAEYGSFEFTADNKYIITQRVTENPYLKSSSTLRSTSDNQTGYIVVIFGDYSSLSANGNTYNLDLKEFGTITITISGSGATIEVNGETYSAGKAEEITDYSKQTELLCHTWTFVKWENDDEDDDEEYHEMTMTFSSAGTYIGHEKTWYEEERIQIGPWKWINQNRIEYTYTASDEWGGTEGSGFAEYEVTEILTILELTDKKLKIQAESVEEDSGEIYYDISTWSR